MRLIFALLTAISLVTAASAQTFKVFYTFNFTDGSLPNGSLLRDSAGNFYGTTIFGGSSNRGVVFKLDSTGHNTTLYQFTGQADGGLPIGRLISDAAGNLYGVTSLGGDPTCSCGTVFKLAPNGTLTVLHAFTGGQDGSQNEGQPELGVVAIGDALYGSASFGGVSGCDGTLGCGVVYKIGAGPQETVLYRFTGQSDGAFPQDLIRDSAGNLYGETGGSYMSGNAGTIFKMDTSGNLTNLYTFPGGSLGNSPRWRLIRNTSGTFYGVTQFGGSTNCPISSAGCGVVFAVNAQGQESVLHTFATNSNDGQEPSGALLNIASNFFGTTFYGGTENSNCTFGCGIVYGVNTSGKYAVLYRFTGGADGMLPTGALTADSAGNLYGAAQSGGNNDNGVIFEITP
jgi:uncharacterized repeat protein (TIGR03803 family)